jgi:hypothetical protein
MTKQQILLGSLSQDLFRIANFIHTHSKRSANRFWQEQKRWLKELEKEKLAPYLLKIIHELKALDFDATSLAQGEKLLTYGVIIQSLACHNLVNSAD